MTTILSSEDRSEDLQRRWVLCARNRLSLIPYFHGDTGVNDYIGKILELFKTVDGRAYFSTQWFFKAEDTVIKDHAILIDKRRVFISDLKNDNSLDCITSKIRIVKVSPNVDLLAKKVTIPSRDFYYDMKYSPKNSTYSVLPSEISASSSKTSSTVKKKAGSVVKSKASEMTLLDLYSGCGAMSTGLCLGASVSGVNLVTRWAVDYNKYACESLKLNHKETEVRNESASSFVCLLKEWKKLCAKFSLLDTKHLRSINPLVLNEDPKSNGDVEHKHANAKSTCKVFEVEKLVGIMHEDPTQTKQASLHFKVRWKGYGSNHDTWEPISGLGNAEERIKEFVTRGYRLNILPLPGDVDVICGGPPCQGISGHNRFRKYEDPLGDEKNAQIVVFMDIVEYLKPRFVLMENVVDILKFSNGYFGRYVLGRMVSLDYQARLGIMVAGCYGLPQFRMRAFFWGARPTEELPAYPFPTHEVVQRGAPPVEFAQHLVAYDESHTLDLADALKLGDAILDLPPVENDENCDERPYTFETDTPTQFHKYIRSTNKQLMCIRTAQDLPPAPVLYDHLPFKLNDDDHQRVCQIPKEKGANFRNLRGVLVDPDSKVSLDPSVERIFLSSGKPLVPNYAITWKNGYSTEPFGRLWWDETVPTVVTRPQPHNRVITHPVQDRVLTVRENARLQGFPDYYKLSGPIIERYMQVGNAVAVPVARALGYTLGIASQGFSSDEPLVTLPPDFSRFD